MFDGCFSGVMFPQSASLYKFLYNAPLLPSRTPSRLSFLSGRVRWRRNYCGLTHTVSPAPAHCDVSPMVRWIMELMQVVSCNFLDCDWKRWTVVEREKGKKGRQRKNEEEDGEDGMEDEDR